MFFVHFRGTSFVADRDGGVAGFLVGFLSPSEPAEAYVHFVGVSPEERRSGLGRTLYERFFELARANGRTRVSCVTSPLNGGSIAFHTALGFEPSPPKGRLRRPRRGQGRAHAVALSRTAGRESPGRDRRGDKRSGETERQVAEGVRVGGLELG